MFHCSSKVNVCILSPHFSILAVVWGSLFLSTSGVDGISRSGGGWWLALKDDDLASTNWTQEGLFVGALCVREGGDCLTVIDDRRVRTNMKNR